MEKKPKERPFHSFRRLFSRVHLVDKCLIVFMLLLMLQSAYTLFFHSYITQEANSIDIIVRTSTASIFGYFLSANFVRNAGGTIQKLTVNEKTAPNPPVPKQEAPLEVVTTADASDASADAYPMDFYAVDDTNTPEDVATAGKLQIYVAAGIGIFCLVTLMFMRNFVDWSATTPEAAATIAASSAAATVGQFRDFVSGCVGFLIGCPTSRDEHK